MPRSACGPAARLPHPADVLDGEPAGAVVHQADHVDADLIETDAVSVQPLHSQPTQPGQLGPAYVLERAAVPQPGPGLDLDDLLRVPVHSHDVDLAGGAAPVAAEDPHADRLQVFG